MGNNSKKLHAKYKERISNPETIASSDGDRRMNELSGACSSNKTKHTNKVNKTEYRNESRTGNTVTQKQKTKNNV